MAHIPAHQVGAGDLHQLAAPQRPDGLEVLGQDAGHGGFAGARVAGEDHVAVDFHHRQALGLAALLGLDVAGQFPQPGLDRRQPHDGVQLGLHRLHVPPVAGGQQCQQVEGFAAAHAGQQTAVFHPQGHRGVGGGGGVGFQHILGQGPVDGVGIPAHGGRAAGLAVLGGQLVPHVRPHAQHKAGAPAHPLGQLVELPGRDGLQAFGGEGDGLADVAGQGVHKAGAEGFGQGGLPFFGEEDEILAAGLQLAHRVGGQGGAHIHQNAPLQHIPAGQRQRALGRQGGQHVAETGGAGFVAVKGQHLGFGPQRGVQVLQKEFFLGRARVEGKVHPLDGGAFQDAPGGQFLHHAAQGVVAAGARRAAEQHQPPGPGARRAAHHKGAAERLDHIRHKGVLPQHPGADLAGQPVKTGAGGCGGGGFGRGLVQQPVAAQVAGELAAHPADALGGGVGGFLHRPVRLLGPGLAFLAGGQGVQLGLHLAQAVPGGAGFLLAGGAGAAHQPPHPIVVLFFQAHTGPSPLWSIVMR